MQAEKTLRLVFGQWQGGNVTRLIPDLDEKSGSQGYSVGAQILDLLLPKTQSEIMRVPVDMRYERREQDKVLDRDIIFRQTKDALKLINISAPDKIVTIGGECSVSVPPFSYLSAKYPDDVCMLWIDAHPDITLPGDAYNGWHAMAVSALLGKADSKICDELPGLIKPEHVLYLGLRDWERDEIKQREQNWGLKHLTPEDLSCGPDKLIAFLQQCPCSKVVVHFDLDVLDPADIFCAVGNVPNGLKLQQCVELIKTAALYKDLVGLTVAELLPRTVIRLTNALKELPLISAQS
ncbi:MAG: arginase family protein [Proteobacteria bacterium]|uniref:Arginase family protein n=1 Tax=Candidatus Avisuccinivibrio stercorigallinarum TaxID=2840704 RepID=A0A9D9DBR9_9GAMM|nr:arginase family protein [Candidatus Avisuccinivibrio stercorigallinarum]